jgi:hypothetical protein
VNITALGLRASGTFSRHRLRLLRQCTKYPHGALVDKINNIHAQALGFQRLQKPGKNKPRSARISHIHNMPYIAWYHSEPRMHLMLSVNSDKANFRSLFFVITGPISCLTGSREQLISWCPYLV